jgi:hypothetical protein
VVAAAFTARRLASMEARIMSPAKPPVHRPSGLTGDVQIPYLRRPAVECMLRGRSSKAVFVTAPQVREGLPLARLAPRSLLYARIPLALFLP